MRLIRSIITFALLGYAVLFCVMNFQRTSVSIPFVAQVESVPLFLVIIGCIIVGILVASLTGMTRGIKGSISKASVNKENKHLKKKLGMYETEQTIQNDVELQNRITDK